MSAEAPGWDLHHAEQRRAWRRLSCSARLAWLWQAKRFALQATAAARRRRGFSFRPLRLEDLQLLHDWLNRPHVARWWEGPRSLDAVKAKYTPRITGGEVRCFLALRGSEAVAFIQSYASGGDPKARGVDVFIAEETLLGKGLGAGVIRAFVELIFSDPSVTCVQADPAPENARAIRAFEKAGFRRQAPARLTIVRGLT